MKIGSEVFVRVFRERRLVRGRIAAVDLINDLILVVVEGLGTVGRKMKYVYPKTPRLMTIHARQFNRKAGLFIWPKE